MLPERVAAVIIENKKLLLVTGEGPDFYWTPGGKVSEDENHETALSRELSEELGVILVSMKPYLVYNTVNEATQKEQVVNCYIAKIKGDPKPSAEIKKYDFYSKDRMPKVSHGIEKYLLPKILKDRLL